MPELSQGILGVSDSPTGRKLQVPEAPPIYKLRAFLNPGAGLRWGSCQAVFEILVTRKIKFAVQA